MINNDIKGIFLLKREFDNKISLFNKETNNLELVDYFEFEHLLKKYFGIDKTEVILDHINCGRKIIIDFNKSIAKLVKEKEYNFKDAMNVYFDPKNIESELNNPFEDEDIYSRFQNL